MSGRRTGLLSFLWACVILGSAGLAAAGGLVYRSAQENALRADMANRFGPQVLSLCASPAARVANARLSNKTNKFLVLDGSNGWIYPIFQNALSTDQSAASKDDVTVVICVMPDAELIQTCKYSPSGSNSGTTRSQIERWSNDLKFTAVEVSTGKTIASNTVTGGDPADCPDTTKSSSKIYGPLPTSQDFLDWLNRIPKAR
jgi:hypothetical protein